MLKGINPILTPDLLKILMEMGHGDEIVISDGNFPAASIAKNLIRLDGLNVPEVLDAILSVMPLDTYVESPVALMALSGNDTEIPPIWAKYEEIVENHQPGTKIENIERFDYYERAKKAYAVVYTTEQAIYANILLKKGVVK